MGSLESGIPTKRDSTGRLLLLQRNRSRISRFLIAKRLGYLQWISTIGVFFFFVVLFQMFLPGLVIDKSDKPWKSSDTNKKIESLPPDLVVFKEKGVFEFGDDVRFEPTKLLMKFQREEEDDGLNFTSSSLITTMHRFGFRKPKLALVFADLLADPEQLLMVTVSKTLQELGYGIEVYSMEDGPVTRIWREMGVSVTILESNHSSSCVIDWLSYDGVIVNSLEARSTFTCFMQEPFKSLPLIWIINEETLAVRSRQYNATGHTELFADWKKIFNRASVIVFHNYLFPILYSEFDTGNFYVIPGSPEEVWKPKPKSIELREKDDLVISIVGSQFLYKGQWLEHALLLQALRPLFPSYSHLKIVVLGGETVSNYSLAIETISRNLTYPKDTVKHVSVAGNVDKILESSDLVIYGSFLEEQSFPEILMKAMALGKPIIAPDLAHITKHVDDRVNGYLYPKENLDVLTKIVVEVMMITEGKKISPLAQKIGLMGKTTVKNTMARETVEGYAVLLENILKLSSEVASPKDITEVPPREEWSWEPFEAFIDSSSENKTARSYEFLAKVERHWNREEEEEEITKLDVVNDASFIYQIWEDERSLLMMNIKKRREDEELKGRVLQNRATWEDVYKTAKRADRSKNDLHERDEGELLRTGQVLCIYEPYFGEGTWSFLHEYPLYRGIGLSVKGRRPKMDDIDASSRLPLFQNPYYRDALGDFGAFFAVSNKIDRLHRNSWIGFQSWRATARKESLSEIAEKALLNAITTRKHGDALYFWVRMDKDPRNPLKKPFWSFCDAINAGNCRFAYNETLKRMYGIKNLNSLPPMPEDGGDTWSVMQSFALPTRSFLEFVMFSRMFVDSLDAQVFEEHHRTNRCYLSLTKDKHCYSRILELLVNVWAYHSARRIIYIDPKTGLIQEQHKQTNRLGKMWIKWFDYTTLKTMDEDLAEEADSDRRPGHWLWPWTGEIVWRGSLEKEKLKKIVEKEEKKKKSKDKLNRMRSRSGRQKVIGKYVKPPPENETTVVIAGDDDNNSGLLTGDA